MRRSRPALSEMEMAEIKTVRKIIATMDVIVARAKAEFRQHARDINHSSEIVMARTQQLDKKKNWACRTRQWLERSENATVGTDWSLPASPIQGPADPLIFPANARFENGQWALSFLDLSSVLRIDTCTP